MKDFTYRALKHLLRLKGNVNKNKLFALVLDQPYEHYSAYMQQKALQQAKCQITINAQEKDAHDTAMLTLQTWAELRSNHLIKWQLDLLFRPQADQKDSTTKLICKCGSTILNRHLHCPTMKTLIQQVVHPAPLQQFIDWTDSKVLSKDKRQLDKMCEALQCIQEKVF